MGNTESKERGLFIDIVKHLLRKKGVQVPTSQLQRFFHFIQECCPWFPEEGTLDLKTWVKIGEALRAYYSNYGPENMPVDAIALWNLLKDMLDPAQEAEILNKINLTVPTEETPLRKDSRSETYVLKKDEEKDQSCLQNKDNLEEAATEYHNEEFFAPISTHSCGSSTKNKLGSKMKNTLPPPPRNVGFKGAMKEALQSGDLSFTLPITFDSNDENYMPQWEPLPLKLLKELKQSVHDYGPTSPYTLQIVEIIASRWMTPYDWFATAKSCLPGGTFLLWKTDYEDRAKERSRYNKSINSEVTLDMLMGENDWAQPSDQFHLPHPALIQCSDLAVNAWRQLENKGVKTSGLSTIKQKPEEPFEEFLSRLKESVEKIITNNEAAQIIIKQLAFENANTTCQTLLRPIRKTGNLSDFVKVCADVSPSYLQGVAIAAALQGQTNAQFLKRLQNREQNKGNQSCFSCGQTGHFSKVCPNKNFQNKENIVSNQISRPKTLCPRCNKGFHWAKDCHSKFHKDGTLLIGGPMPQKFPQITANPLPEN
uniref:endogenous retrovirus group K member 5 Gag polyprotein-like n=1 Tax=Callospermophilus lateralis TaxID=76772 RepID=UPI004038F55E